MHRQTLVRAMRAAGLAAMASAAVVPPAAAAPSSHLLKQITAATEDGVDSASVGTTGGHTYFNANDGGSHSGPWIVTAGGASPLADNAAWPRRASAGNWTTVGDKTYFTGGGRLWVTDGTAAGTAAVPAAGTNVRNLAPGGSDELLFSGDGYSNAKRLTISTGVVDHVVLDGDQPQLYVEQFLNLPGTLLTATFDFTAQTNQRRLVAGTGAESHILQAGGEPLVLDNNSPQVTAIGGRAYFVARVAGAGDPRPYSTDGTDAGTHELRTPADDPISIGNDMQFVETSGGKAVFLAGGVFYETAGETTTNAGVGPAGDGWRSPVYASGKLLYGTNDKSGGHLWAHTLAGEDTPAQVVRDADVSRMTVSEGVVYAILSSDDASALVRTDGTPAGTTSLTDPLKFTELNDLSPKPGGGVFLDARSVDFGREVFVVTGTPGDPVNPVVDANSKPTGAQINDDPRKIARVGSKTLFLAGGANDEESQPWITDGTTAGTHALAPGHRFDETYGATSFGSRAAFEVDGPTGHEVWVTDGTEAGTARISVATRDAIGANASDPAPIGNSLYYVARTTSDPEQSYSGIFKSDGNGPGTPLEAPVGTPLHSYIYGVKAVGTKLYYTLADADDYQQRQFWVLDTVSGESTELSGEYNDYNLTGAVVAGGKLYLAVGLNTEPWENQVWVTDGTVAGTTNLDLEPGERPSNGAQTRLATDGTTVYASIAAVGGGSYEAHVNRIVGSTVTRLVDGPSASASSLAYATAVIDGALYARIDHSLVKVAPDADQATVVKSFADYLSEPTVIGGKLYFSGSDSEHGYEPWISDGTPDGTRLLADTLPGADSSEPSAFFAAGDQIAFAAYDPAIGYQLFAFGEPEPEPVAPTTPQPTTPEPTTPQPTTPAGTPETTKSADPVSTPATAGPPAPPAKADTRAVVTKVESDASPVKETKKAYAFEISGTVLGAKGLRTRAECRGQVEILITATTKKGKGKTAKTIVKEIGRPKFKLVWQDGTCGYDKTIKIAKKDVPAGAKLEATVTFRGSSSQQPKTAEPITLSID